MAVETYGESWKVSFTSKYSSSDVEELPPKVIQLIRALEFTDSGNVVPSEDDLGGTLIERPEG